MLLFFVIGLDNIYGRIIDLDQVYGKEPVAEKLFPLVVVTMIRPLLTHL